MDSSDASQSQSVQRAEHYREAEHTASVGLGFNMLLVIVKFGCGWITGSAALVADAFNSISDVAGSVAVRGALWMAQQEEDEDHPYGHTKAETIGALSISILIAFSAGMLAVETMRRIWEGSAVPPAVAAYTAAGCAIVKEILYRYTIRKSEHLGSRALEAVAWDHRSDAICSGLIAVSLLVAPSLGNIGTYVDPLAALGVCGFLLYVGIRLFQRTGADLMDQQADSEMIDSVRASASQIDDVSEIEKLRVRKSGLEYFIEIHVQVDGELTVSDGHRIGHRVKDRLIHEFPMVRDVHVHIEPAAY